ncbi:hypothetical protein ABTY96_11015 [Streptomyces sp. NPDC096057]|uniref:hypothetical protein n=1 Tax=Streptomyces sp. NPDC096057 TaxID=3155543 RepID=UPI0033290DF1
MNVTRRLATIDLLCTRDFLAEYGRTDAGTGGPGCHIAEPRTSGDFWEGAGMEQEETEARYEIDRDALGERLIERWGAPDAFSLASVLERSLSGEDIPERDGATTMDPQRRSCDKGPTTTVVRRRTRDDGAAMTDGP